MLFIGRLTQQKNLSRLLQGLSVLARRHPIRLRIIGEGPLRGALEKEAAQLGVDCVFEGTVPHRDLPGFLNQADLFVLPSLIEGHPKVLIEAISCGVPCVISSCEGNRALIEHEKTGLLFDPTDVANIMVELQRALNDDGMTRELSRAARQYILANYDLAHLLKRETDVLLTIAERGTS